MLPRIFISHTSEDRPAAARIAAALEARGLACWIAPRDIAAGLDWADAIMLGLAEAGCMLVVHSAATSASPMVRRELNSAVTRGLPLLPVRIDDSEPQDGIGFYLATAQWLDARSVPIEQHAPQIAAAAERLMQPVPMDTGGAADFADRPAIAVLPFRGLGDTEALADMLTDELIAAISAWRDFPVIARGAVQSLAQSAIDTRVIGRLLGVRYLVTGRLRATAAGLRASFELVDVPSGTVLATGTSDHAAQDRQAALDDMVLALAGALSPELLQRERNLAASRPLGDATVYGLLRRAFWHRRQETREDHATAETLFHRALEIAPGSAEAMVGLSLSRNFAVLRHWAEDVAAARLESHDWARRAVEADPHLPDSHFALGIALMNLGRREAAQVALGEAIALNPSHAEAHANLGQLYNYLDHPEQALPQLALALRLTPRAAYRYQWLPYVAASHYLAGRYRQALVASQEALEARPSYPPSLRYLIVTLGQLGRRTEAAPAVALLRQIDGGAAGMRALLASVYVASAAERLMTGAMLAGLD